MSDRELDILKIKQWNDTYSNYNAECLLHQQFESISKTNPSYIALEFEGESITYGEMDERSNKYAQYISQLGVNKGSYVGIFMYRSIEMLIAIYGILKAGAAYIPIDPDFPKNRIKYIVSDAGLEYIFTHGAVNSDVLNVKNVINIDNTNFESVSNFKVDLKSHSSSNVAYVIYTSGTTGNPKGVMISHKSIVNRLDGMQKEYKLTKDDVLLQKTPYTFDVSVWELFWPLMVGAKLYILKPDGHKYTSYLKKIIKTNKISTVHFVPSMLRLFLEFESFSECINLKRVICSGESLPYDLMLIFFNDSDVELHNLYGPTEAAIDVTYWRCKRSDKREFVPIGFPVNNTQLYILDDDLSLSEIGADGELFIAGDQVAIGYLNNPILTNEKFINNPFSTVEDSKMYRTGDLVKYGSMGELIYIGRNDFQVKINGLRVELGEIEVSISKHDNIKQCVVTVRENTPGNHRLIAYSILEKGEKITSAELKSYLRDRLPEYMIPTYFMELEKFPVTSNGKLDRKSLPDPPEGSLVENKIITPRNDAEKKLSVIWSNVLGVKVERISIYDNFFDLGGHSLLSLQVISKINELTGKELKLRVMLENTLEQIAILCGFEDLKFSKEPKYKNNSIIKRERKFYTIKTVDYGEINGCLFPASFSQKQLWYINQSTPNSSAYNISYAYKVLGTLDYKVLAQAVNELIERHESFRTVFQLSDNGLNQLIIDSVKINFVVQDVSSKSEFEIEKIINDFKVKPFDLNSEPLIRVSLLEVGEKQYIILFSFHHIISDFVSLVQFFKELSVLYLCLLKGEESTLYELDVQYADYSSWFLDECAKENMQLKLSFWVKMLTGHDYLIEFPTDYKRPPIQKMIGGTCIFSFPETLSYKILEISNEEKVSTFITLLAGFLVLLKSYTNKDSVIVGVPFANRNSISGLDKIVGCFINTLPIVNDLSGDPSFKSVLSKVNDVVLDALDNQDVPLELLIEELKPDNDPSYNPLYQIGFNYLDDSYRFDLEGCKVNLIPFYSESSKLDLMMTLNNIQGNVSGYIEYDTELFDYETIERFSRYYSSLLELAVSEPDIPISNLCVYRNSELKKIDEWNNTASEYDMEQLLQHQFERISKSTPNTIALECEGESLTYGEMDREANQYAKYLISLDVKQGSYVGIFMYRSIEMLVSIYSVLKSGAAYIPIDPDFPKSRIDYIVSNAGLDCVFTHNKVDVNLLTVKNIINVDEIDFTVNDHLEVPGNYSSSTVAYVIYTSGTTGNPKGVMISHKSIVNRLDWMQKKYNLSISDVVLQKTPYTFDVSVWELFWPLMIGAKLQIAKPDGHKDPSYLKQVIRDKHITTLHFVPSMLRLLLEFESFSDCESLKRVFCSGEALPYDLTQIFFNDCDAELHNLYGPTEASVDVSYWQCKKNDEKELVPIGFPVNNTQLHILDKNLKPVLIGTVGELHIGGDQVALGYLNNPKLTEEKFIDDPFLTNKSAKMYKTGDLVRYRQSGEIIYIGRNDFQVKINGLRIELGEIETVMSNQSTIKHCVAIVREDSPGDPRLVAYYIPVPGKTVMETELRKSLRRDLPDYMIPQHLVELDEFPLTANGKVDRNALPSPYVTTAFEVNVIAPRNAAEQKLAEIWSDVLGIEVNKISVHDNFFDIGGHSLLSMNVIAKVYEQTNVKLNPRGMILSSLEHIAPDCGFSEGINDKSGVIGSVVNLFKKIMHK